jgi:hypothetical protein
MTDYEKIRDVLIPLLQPGEELRHYTYGTDRKVGLTLLVLLGSGILVANMMMLVVGGHVGPLSSLLFFFLWISSHTVFLNWLKPPKVLALTDRRLVLVGIKLPYFKTGLMTVMGKVQEYAPIAWPTGELKKATLTLKGSDWTLKFTPWSAPENIDAAEHILAQLATGDSELPR